MQEAVRQLEREQEKEEQQLRDVIALFMRGFTEVLFAGVAKDVDRQLDQETVEGEMKLLRVASDATFDQDAEVEKLARPPSLGQPATSGVKNEQPASAPQTSQVTAALSPTPGFAMTGQDLWAQDGSARAVLLASLSPKQAPKELLDGNDAGQEQEQLSRLI